MPRQFSPEFRLRALRMLEEALPEHETVVVELKTSKFDPRDTEQFSFYVALVDDWTRIDP